MGAISRLSAPSKGLPRRCPVACLSAALIAANLAAWAWALAAFSSQPVLLGAAWLAYSLGLRHAVDADHIAAIDGVTRKLMQDGKRPLTVGLYFSLGHSTVVFGLSASIAATALAVKAHFPALAAWGDAVGTAISSLFLLVIALINFMVLRSVWQAFRRLQRGEPAAPGGDGLALAGGIMTALFRKLFDLIGQSWHMFPLGLLFGLGFDTATEVGLLGISATEAGQGLPAWSIMVFPALFAAGMSLVDTADGVLMTGAYGWAFVKPVRKLWYNLTITAASVMVAVLVGGIEALTVLAERLKLSGPFWSPVTAANAHLGLLGAAIIGLFAGVWLVSVLAFHLLGADRLEGATG